MGGLCRAIWAEPVVSDKASRKARHRSSLGNLAPAAGVSAGHSRKPDELYKIIEECSWRPFLELFGSSVRESWTV